MSPSSYRKHSPIALRVIERYGNALSFATTFNPDMQITCARNIERSFMGDAPTIAALNQAYSDVQVVGWIIAQLTDLYKFTGVKDKMDIRQMECLAEIIRTEYFYLKSSELLLFFFKFKAGEFGTFYGVVDALVISNALVEFKKFRQQQIEKFERETNDRKMEAKLEEWKRDAIPCPDNMRNLGDVVKRFNQEK